MVAVCVVGRWLCAAVLMGLAVGCVSNLGNFMLKLIQKNNNKFVMTNMCMCVILLLLRLAANMFMNNIHSKKNIEFNQFENGDVPCGETHVQGISGSSPTHGELLEVADHSSCRKMYAVPSLAEEEPKKEMKTFR